MSKYYELVIFDWDGTLVDSQAQIVQCMREAFMSLDLEPPNESAIRQIVGLSLDIAVARLMPDLDKTMQIAVANVYRDIAFAHSNHSSFPFYGVKISLKYLRQCSLYLAIATGKGRRGLDAALKGSGLSSFFDITRCADETLSKPDPMMLEEILADLDINVEKAIMVGDTSYDIEMAKNIGMDSIAVTYGMHDEVQLNLCPPNYLIHDITEIQNLIIRNPHV